MMPKEADVHVQVGERAQASYQYRTVLRAQIRAKQFEDFVKRNIVEKSVCNNNQSFKPITAESTSLETLSLLGQFDWNRLSETSEL